MTSVPCLQVEQIGEDKSPSMSVQVQTSNSEHRSAVSASTLNLSKSKSEETTSQEFTYSLPPTSGKSAMTLKDFGQLANSECSMHDSLEDAMFPLSPSSLGSTASRDSMKDRHVAGIRPIEMQQHSLQPFHHQNSVTHHLEYSATPRVYDWQTVDIIQQQHHQQQQQQHQQHHQQLQHQQSHHQQQQHAASVSPSAVLVAGTYAMFLTIIFASETG